MTSVPSGPTPATSTQLADEIRATLRLGGPLAAAQLAHAAMGAVAVQALGQLGATSLAGAGVGATVFSFFLVVGSGIVSSVGSLAAEAHGRGQADEGASVARDGLVLAVVLGGLAVPMLLGAEVWLAWLGQTKEVAASARDYLGGVAWGLPPALGFLVLRNYQAALGRAGFVAVVAACAAAASWGLNRAALGGVLGPAFRTVRGVGLCTALAYGLGFIAVAAHAIATSTVGQRAGRRSGAGGIRRLLAVGLPVGVLYGLESGLFAVVTLWAAGHGAADLAAHHVALQISYVTFMVPSGIGLATAARVARAFGAGDRRAATRAAIVGLSVGTGSMMIASTLCWFVPSQLVSLLLPSDDFASRDARAAAEHLLAIVALFQIADGIQGIAAGALRGLRDTRAALVIGSGAFWGVGATLAFVLGVRGSWGVPGLWTGLAIGLGVAAVCLCARLWRRLAAFDR